MIEPKFIGRQYEPYDNSWSINIITGENSYLTERTVHLSEEEGAVFIIVSEPYEQEITTPIVETKTFVNVISSKTRNIYRTLYYHFAVKKQFGSI